MAHLNLSLLRPAAEIRQNIPLSQSRNLEFMSQHTMRKFKGALPLESLLCAEWRLTPWKQKGGPMISERDAKRIP